MLGYRYSSGDPVKLTAAPTVKVAPVSKESSPAGKLNLPETKQNDGDAAGMTARKSPEDKREADRLKK